MYNRYCHGLFFIRLIVTLMTKVPIKFNSIFIIFIQLGRTTKLESVLIFFLFLHTQKPPDIGMMVRVFANGPGDLGSILGRVIPKTQKMVLDASLLNTQQYKVGIETKVEQSRERSLYPPLHLGVVAIENGAFTSPSTKVANFTYFLLH